ncbi:MAG: hypothetical protein Q7K39_00240 [Candidatus Magasanikbacteria bacterium]|nr:hypothetical protein [Candidatus Magasanikbacteria bacterium]
MSPIRPVLNLADFVARSRAVLKNEPPFVSDFLDNPQDHVTEILVYMTSYAVGGGEPQLLLTWFQNFLAESEIKRIDHK